MGILSRENRRSTFALTVFFAPVRMLRALIVYGIFDEPEEEVYEHNALSRKLSTGRLRTVAYRL